MGKKRTGLDGSPNGRKCEKCGIFEAKRRFTLAKVQLLSRMKTPSLNQAQSAAWPLQWVSQMCHWVRPFLAALYDFFGNRSEFGGGWIWQKTVDYELKIWRFP